MFNTNIGSNLLYKNDSTEVDTSMPKIISIGVLGLILGIAISYFLNSLVENPSAANFTWAASLIVLFIITFFLQSIFVKSLKLNLLIILVEMVGLTSFFIIKNYSLILLIAIVLTYAALFSAAKKSKGELSNQLKISMLKVARLSVPKIVTAIAILISVVYSQPFFPQNLVISKNLIKSIIAPSEILIKIADNYLHIGLTNFAVDKTISQLADEMAQKSELPIGSQIIEQGLIMQASQIGLTIKSEESLLDVAYNFINSKVQNLNKTMKWVIFGAMFLLIFLTIKGIFWVFHWLLYVLIYLFYEILMALGFCKLSYEQISKEIIVL